MAGTPDTPFRFSLSTSAQTCVPGSRKSLPDAPATAVHLVARGLSAVMFFAAPNRLAAPRCRRSRRGTERADATTTRPRTWPGVPQQCCVVGSPRRSVLRLRVHQWRVLGLLASSAACTCGGSRTGFGVCPGPVGTQSLPKPRSFAEVPGLPLGCVELRGYALRLAEHDRQRALLALRSASARAGFASSSWSDSAFRADAAAAALSRASAHARRRAISSQARPYSASRGPGRRGPHHIRPV